ncbi:MAG: hypothetical protein ACI9GK_000751 [Devosia sp.]|jgi:hypothetical protein|tara:strand:- start:10 stop:318 length:309 start_codon:yes stop_codon:yes gene_type:complete
MVMQARGPLSARVLRPDAAKRQPLADHGGKSLVHRGISIYALAYLEPRKGTSLNTFIVDLAIAADRYAPPTGPRSVELSSASERSFSAPQSDFAPHQPGLER